MTIKRKPKRKEHPSGKRFDLETLEPVDWLPRGYLSVSAAGMYLRCPKQFEFRYIHGIKEPPKVVMVEGISHHNWLEYNNNHWMKEHENLRLKEAQEAFLERWVEKAKENRWGRPICREVEGRGRLLVERYMEDVAPFLQPSAAEGKFELMAGNVPMLGFIDVECKLEGKKTIADYKVVARKKSDRDAENELQLGVYAEARGTVETAFISLCKTKVPKIEIARAKQTKRRKKWAKMVVQAVGEAITKGSFPPCAPTTNTCNAKFCGYWSRCRGAKQL